MSRKLLVTVGMSLVLLLQSACGGSPVTPQAQSPQPTLAPVHVPSTPTPANPPAPTPLPLPAPGVYDIGSPIMSEVWVDPVKGSDENTGATRDQALHSLTEAWNRIPMERELTTGYRILLAPGVHPKKTLPDRFESRYGTAQFPILIQAADGPGTTTLGGALDIFDTRYLYLIDLNIVPNPPGDAVHCEQCDHFLVRRAVLDGSIMHEARQTLKVSQSQYVYVEASDVFGAADNALDFVAVQYGHVIGNRLHNARHWCAAARGGSAYLRLEGNELYKCGVGGFTAGGETGLQFMRPPWITYEAYDIKVINNILHDMEGAALGVNGGYNILLAYNLIYRVGKRDHALEFGFGWRTCEGRAGETGRDRCQSNLAAGGWGTTMVDDAANAVRIPNQNVFVYNNIVYNPPGEASGSKTLMVLASYNEAAQAGSNVPAPALADDNLQIRGNVIWDGDADQPLGIEDGSQGCQSGNPTCTAAQIAAENVVNSVEPQLDESGDGHLYPLPGSNIFSLTTYPIPDFTWANAPSSVPVGNLSNAVPEDFHGQARPQPSPPGAHVATSASR